MDALDEKYRQGYYSIVRWRRDATRDEARNVAVILVSADGQMGGIRAAPISTISSRLSDQGWLDAILNGVAQRFAAGDMLTLDDLTQLSTSLQQSLYLTPPAPTAVSDVDTVLSALYKALVAPRGGGSSILTKSRVLDRVVNRLRRQGYRVARGKYVDDFLFDAIVESSEHLRMIEVLSFASTAKNWVSVEKDAGHFLYALEHVHGQGIAVVQPPTDATKDSAADTYERVLNWFRRDDVPTVHPDELGQPQLALPL
jgi:hypothetical protein